MSQVGGKRLGSSSLFLQPQKLFTGLNQHAEKKGPRFRRARDSKLYRFNSMPVRRQPLVLTSTCAVRNCLHSAVSSSTLFQESIEVRESTWLKPEPFEGCGCSAMAPKAKRATVAVDPIPLSKEVAELLRDEAKRGAFLDLRCGSVSACRCLLAAASTSLDGAGGGEPEAKAALEAAGPHVAAALLQLACGDEVLLRDDNELFDLFSLARTLGADACRKACGKAIGDSVDFDEGK